MPILAEPATKARARGSACLHGGGKRFRVVGSVRSSASSRVDCDQPLRAVCRDCDEVAYWRCDSYSCTHCSDRKRQRLARLVDNGSAIHLANGMIGYFLTLTAPGVKDHARWYQGKRPRSRVACSCHLHGFTDGQWNAQESACWNRLRTALTRSANIIFAGAVETQERDMLHRHVMLFSDRVLTHAEVQAAAVAAGYGCVLDLETVKSSTKAARYISKYVTKSAAGRAIVPWEKVNPETGELLGKRATYRLWSSSRRWGVTMKEIRATQAAQARNRALYLRELAGLDVAASGTQPAPDDSTGSDPP